MISIAVLGYGTVGSGVVEVIEKNKDVIDRRAGEEIRVKYILDLRDFPGDPYADRVVHDVNVILQDPEVSIICETMGGNEPAFTYSMQALKAGKSVCTSNKELVANHGAELIRTAKENSCNYLFEASVGGGIPIIRPLNAALTAERIELINGILNGTTNYILTRMAEEGSDFETSLKEAQEKGYAERNPEADVEGYDACRKIAILTSLVSGRQVDYEDIYTEGITKITAEDIKYAKKMGRAVKLLAMSKKEDGKFFAMVAPFLIGEMHPLYSVNGVFNAIFAKGNVLGDVMFYGSGAGKLPTASAVVADVVDAAKHLHRSIMTFWSTRKLELTDISNAKRRFFVRAKGDGQTDAIRMAELFGPIELVNADLEGEFGFITGAMTEAEYKERAAKTDEIIHMIRVEG